MTSNARPVIEVSDLTVTAGGQILLERASLTVGEGELCLLVGASGTGKSVTLGLLSGLVNPGRGLEAWGRISVRGEQVLERTRSAGIPGCSIVFQDFALLDDVNAEGNVLFGLDHGKDPPADRRATASEILEEFGLPGTVFPAFMSGGMKQRLAIARTLAFGPELVFFDEPTSGLDPALRDQMAQRIREVHERHKMTTVVVTHDLESFEGIPDRIFLLDAHRRCYREVPPEDVREALQELRGFRIADPPIASAGLNLSGRVTTFLEGAGEFVLGAGRTLRSLVPRYPSRRWGFHFLWYFLRLNALGSALPFLALAGFIAGFITAYFMFSLLPVKEFTEPVLEEEFIGALGYALFRVVIPGVATLLFASRAGAAVASDIGNRVLSRQFDAMRSQGIIPARYLLTGLSLSSLIGIPLLFFVAYWVARVAAVGVFLATHPGFGPFSFNEHFYRMVGEGGVLPGGSGWVLGKLLISAVGTAGIAYHLGSLPKRSGADVARGVTSAIIRTTVFVLIVHLIFAFCEFS